MALEEFEKELRKDSKKKKKKDWFTEEFHISWMVNWPNWLRWIIALPFGIFFSLIARGVVSWIVNKLFSVLPFLQGDIAYTVLGFIGAFIGVGVLLIYILGAIPSLKRTTYWILSTLILGSLISLLVSYYINGEETFTIMVISWSEMIAMFLGGITAIYLAHNELKKHNI